MLLGPRPRIVWRPFGDTAARFAAPWWALVWVLTFGRMGAPLWRERQAGRSLKPTGVPRVPSPLPPPGPDRADMLARLSTDLPDSLYQPGAYERLPLPPAGFRGDVLAAGYRYPPKPPPPPAPPPRSSDPGRETR